MKTSITLTMTRWFPAVLGLAFCLWGVVGALLNNAIMSCLQNGCVATTLEESPMEFLFMLCVHLSVGYVAIKDTIKLVSRNNSKL